MASSFFYLLIGAGCLLCCRTVLSSASIIDSNLEPNKNNEDKNNKRSNQHAQIHDTTMSSIMNNHQQLATFMGYLPISNSSSSISANGGSMNNSGNGSRGGSRGGSGVMGTGGDNSSGNSSTGSDSSNVQESTNKVADGNSQISDSGYSSELSDSGSEVPTGDSSIESDEFEDINERIEFIQAKQEILGKANGILFDQEDLLTAEKASKKQQAMLQKAGEGNEGHGEDCESASSLSSLDSRPTIWTEAREILHKINHNSGNHASQPPATLNHPSFRKKAGSAPNPRDPLIRISGVKRLASTAFRDENISPPQRVPPSDDSSRTDVGYGEDSVPEGTTSVKSRVTSLFGAQTGHWMAQALIRSASSASSSSINFSSQVGQRTVKREKPTNSQAGNPKDEEADWKVIPSSPDRPMDMLLPPPGRLFRHASVDMYTATAPQTNQPRLVTQATPPFLVVYANRAFLKLVEGGSSEESESSATAPVFPGSSSNLIGKPVESLIQVIRGLDEEEESEVKHRESETSVAPTPTFSRELTNPQDPSFESILIPNGKHCHIQIVPVVDRSFPTKQAQTRASNKMKVGATSRCMSHLMVQLVSLPTRQAHANSSISIRKRPGIIQPKPLRIVVAQKSPLGTSSASNSSHSSDDKPSVLGTVG